MKSLVIVSAMLLATCAARAPQQPVLSSKGVEIPAYDTSEDIVAHLG